MEAEGAETRAGCCSSSGEGDNVSDGSDADGDSDVLHDSNKPFTEASFLGVHGVQGANDNKGVLEVTAGEVPLQQHLGEGVEAEDMGARMKQTMVTAGEGEAEGEGGKEDTVMDRVGVGDAGRMAE